MLENQIRKEKLSNGLEVLLIPSKSAPVVALQGWIKFGAADESDNIAGIAHLFEHLLFKGTTHRKVGQIAQEIEGLGGDLNAYTSYDQTVMHMTLPSTHLHQGIDILSDAIINSVVDDKELENERPVILEEIKRRNDMPSSKTSDQMRKILFNAHPYSRPVIGYADVVSKMSRQEIMTEYRKNYVAGKVFLVLSGDFHDDTVLKVIEEKFRALPKNSAGSLSRGTAQSIHKVSYSFQHDASPDHIYQLGWLGPKANDPVVPALDALAFIMGQGESGRLARKLVLEKELLRDIGCGCWSPKDQGSFVIGLKGTAGTSAKFPEIMSHIRTCFEGKISQDELDRAKKNLLSSAIYSKETVDGLAERFGYFECITNNWKEDLNYLERVRGLTLADVEKAQSEYINWDAFAVGGVVPEKEKFPELSFKKLPAVKAKSGPKMQKTEWAERFEFNGLKVVVRTLNHLPTFSLRWAGLGGLNIEPTAKNGLGTLWARTVSQGFTDKNKKQWSREELQNYWDKSAASYGAFFGKNTWGFQVDGLSEDFQRHFEILLGGLERPTFDKKIFAQEKKFLLQDYVSKQNQPGFVVSELFAKAIFPATNPYSKSSLGTPKSLKSISDKDLAKLHALCRQRPQGLSVVGNVEAEDVYNILQGALPKAKFPAHKKLSSAKGAFFNSKNKGQEFRKYLKKEQTHLIYGFPSCDIWNKDRWALLALGAVLSGQGGRLFMELRDKKSLCYTVAPMHMEGLYGGYFGFYIATSPDKEALAMQSIKEEIEKICSQGITAEEWEKAKNFYVGNHLIEQQRFASQSISMLLEELYGFGFEEHFLFEEKFSKVTLNEINAVARKYFDGKAKGLGISAIVGPQ